MEAIEVKEVIIQREYTEAELLVNIVVLVVPAKVTSSTLELLCNKVPLGDFGLLHCKRVRKIPQDNAQNHVILCPEYHVPSLISEAKTLYETHPHIIVPVPKVAPELTKEFQDWSIYWPLNFHPGERDRQQVKGLTKAEVEAIQRHSLRLLQDDDIVRGRLNTTPLTGSKSEEAVGSGICGGLVVNPFNNEVVCTSSEAIAFLETLHPGYSFMQHPILTPTMLCIDHVAHVSRRAAPGKGKMQL